VEVFGGSLGLVNMKHIALTVMLAASVPSLFATAELELISGTTTVNILDGSGLDSYPTAGVVTYIGAVGGWDINVTTGLEGDLPFFDLVSVDSTKSQTGPLLMFFSDDGLTLPAGFVFDVGGTASSTGSKTLGFGAWTGNGKFDMSKPIGTELTFNTTAFSGATSGAVGSGDDSVTIGAFIDLGNRNAGTASFDAALDSVPEPASISLLGGVLLVLGSLARKGRRK
jgi:hypothetical protein